MTGPLDPGRELLDIDAGKYPEYPDHFAISRLGLQLHLWEDNESAKESALKLNELTGALRIAEEQTKASIIEAGRNAWWSRWSPLLVLGVGTVAAIAGAVVGILLGQQLSGAH